MVEHYVCDFCGYDTTSSLRKYTLPMNNNYEKEVHLCKECIGNLNKYLTDKKDGNKLL